MATVEPMARYTVRIELPVASQANGVVGAAARRLDASLPAQPDHAVRDAQLESEIRRGRLLARVRVSMTVAAADPGEALVTGIQVLRQAIGADAPAWDLVGISATVRPAPGRLLRAVPA
jgi:hypothetical protein